jgi:hypothetical protein
MLITGERHLRLVLAEYVEHCWRTATSRATRGTGNGSPGPGTTPALAGSSTRYARPPGLIPAVTTSGATCPSWRPSAHLTFMRHGNSPPTIAGNCDIPTR